MVELIFRGPSLLVDQVYNTTATSTSRGGVYIGTLVLRYIYIRIYGTNWNLILSILNGVIFVLILILYYVNSIW